MDDRSKLDALADALCRGNKSEFARMIGAKQGTVASWYSRNTLNVELILRAIPRVNREWLIRGEGEMFLPEKKEFDKDEYDRLISELQETTRQLEELVEKLRTDLEESRRRNEKLIDKVLELEG